MKKRKFTFYLGIPVIIIIAVFLFSGGAYIYWNTSSPAKTCYSCHEIQHSFATWSASAHRELNCFFCHGTALSEGFHSLKEKSRMVASHFTKKPFSEDITLNERQMNEMSFRCKSCHEQEYAMWLSGGHSLTYADVFLNENQNSAEQPNEDCFRCHGMFYSGNITSLIEPVSVSGPWKLVPKDHYGLPVIPCLSCHSVHTEGYPKNPPEYQNPEKIFYEKSDTYATAGIFNRQEHLFFNAEDLPQPGIFYKDRTLKTSGDPLVRICKQCHAPNVRHQAGTSDDRTPAGVHEGISCLACHEKHSNNSKRSCINCHPAISNCGLDVTAMNTSYADPESPNNIHFVSCKDCHAGIMRYE